MIWIVAKAESRFNKEQDQSEYRATEVVQVCRTEIEAEQVRDIFYHVSGCEFAYVVINNSQIGEWVR